MSLSPSNVSFFCCAPFWLWSSCLILTLCRCCLTISLHKNLLMRGITHVSSIKVYLTSNQKVQLLRSIIITVTLVSLILATALIILNSGIRKKTEAEREKPSPFECGFDPKSSARLPFSLRFYLVAVIFLIFDVEITLIIPLPVILASNNLNFLPPLAIFFIIILLLGLYHEWNEGALNWDE